MPHSDEVPIVAIATAPGRAGIGVVRVSGPQIDPVVAAVLGPTLAARLRPRHATRARFLDAHQRVIDDGIAILYRAPYSYTGQDVLELQGHGGPLVQRMLQARCLEAGRALGARLAEPGEFTLRAFLNDRIDLAQAEAVADLIDASTEAAARSASRSLAGEFSAALAQLAEQLTQARALVEATNVGKSSLLNALAGQDVAIVTAHPGTTRDRIERSIDIGGLVLNVIDTAGLRATADEVEQLGIDRTLAAVGEADIVLELVDATSAPERGSPLDSIPLDSIPLASIPAWRQRIGAHAARIVVINKIDLSGEVPGPNAGRLYISAKTGAGLDSLRAELLHRAGWY